MVASERRIRVLHVSETLGSGVATALQAYISATPQFDHIVLASPHRGYSIGKSRGAAGSVAFIEMRARRLQQFIDTARALRCTQPDLVHAHSSWAGALARPLARLMSYPIVYSPHCYAFLREDVSRAARALFWLVERVLARITSGYAVAGPFEARLSRRLSRRALIAEVVPALAKNPILTETVAKTHDICTVGRICPQKGPEFFIEVIDLLHEAGWHGSATWIGAGDEREEGLLRERGICVTGWQNRDDVLATMSGSRIYIHTATWEAGFPYAVLEAAALGLPIVARAIGPLRDRTGPELFSSTSSMAERLLELLDSEDESAKLARSCTQSAGPAWKELQGVALSTLYRQLVPVQSVQGRRASKIFPTKGL